MGKYPAADEITSSPFALHVANVRNEFWEDQIRYYKRYNLLQDDICSCCHATQEERIRRAMGVTENVMNPSLHPLSQSPFTKRKQPKHRLDSSGKKKKKLKSTAAVKQARKSESHAFDVYGASTSARAM
ncbi:hypothetical protein D9613_012102 [Agrocybe pediades]|uniref:Uncharacterized protein n=1 Tax=Agrocybe pediades TaxID=84607 RepID=A0A8H4VVW0_9AGAR|nr:hypothetical protein D9613_012102 [Agrocybe pediades]